MAAAIEPATPQPTPGDVIGPVLDRLPPVLLPPLENETGQDLQSEDIRIRLGLDVVNADYEVVGILFGGGKVGADVQAQMRLEFRGLSLARLDEALRHATGEANVSVARTFGVPADRMALTAEEVRLAGGGQLLAMVEAYESAQATRYLEAALPGITVLSMDLTWSNTLPLERARSARLPNGTPLPSDALERLDPAVLVDLREPPLVLQASATLRYLQRTNLLLLLEGQGGEATPGERATAELTAALQAREAGTLDRTAFQLLGFAQVLNATVPPGWLLEVTMRVPQGFTIEGATSELDVAADHRGLTYRLDGDGQAQVASEASLVTLSNRFLVTATALAAIAVVGYAVRLPLEAATLWGLHVAHRRKGSDAVAPRLFRWPGQRLR